MGIAHTRWATHGKPSVANAHPHSDCKGDIYLVHNGIIENYKELKEGLVKRRHKFSSETDSEVMAHLIEEFHCNESLEEAVRKSLLMVRGTYGLVVMSRKEPGRLIVARNGSPLVLGIGHGEFVIASDVAAIIRHTDQVIYLNDGELASVSQDDFEVKTLRRKKIEKLP